MTFFHKINFHFPLASMGAQSWAQDDPKCPEGAKKNPRSSLLGAKNVTFTCEVCESGPLLKHQQGLCFHHIMKVRAPPFLLQNSLRERTAHREHFFSHFWLHFWFPRSPKAAQGILKRPKRTPKASPGTSQIHQKTTWDLTLVFKVAREAPGVPPGLKMTSNRRINYKKYLHSALFF